MSRDLTKFLDDDDIRDEVLKIGFNLCPVKSLGARQDYAGRLLDWIERGETPENRYARVRALRRLYWTRVGDATLDNPVQIDLEPLLLQLPSLVVFIERGDR